MRTDREPLLRPATEGRSIAVGGDVYRFLATGEETDGKVGVPVPAGTTSAAPPTPAEMEKLLAVAPG